MNSQQQLLRYSLANRVLMLVVVVVLLVGVITLSANYVWTEKRTGQQAIASVEQLISTVEPSLQIACFLNDTQLAKEVVRGLLIHPLVARAEIYSDAGDLLAKGKQPGLPGVAPSDQSRIRLIYSPFDHTEFVGFIEVHLSGSEIRQRVYDSLFLVGGPIIGQTLFAGLALMVAILLFFRPRIRYLMSQIQQVNVEGGETLNCPKADQKTELGVLVSYINQLILKMYFLLESERDLRLQQEVQQHKYKTLFEFSSSCIFLMDADGKLLSCNKACQNCSLTAGFFAEDGATVWVPEILAAGDHERWFFIDTILEQQRDASFEIYLPGIGQRSDHWYQVNLIPVDEHTYQGVINEITELKLEAQAARDIARTDTLTQLANRLGFVDQLDHELQQTALGQQSLAVLLIDLDEFKQVNDTYGHEAGDQVLVRVAERMRASVRDQDCIARLGGDEFVIMLPRAPRDVVERITQGLIESLNEVIPLHDGQSANVGCSIGIVCLEPGERTTARDLMHKADEQMYRVKNSGKNNYCFFDKATTS